MNGLREIVIHKLPSAEKMKPTREGVSSKNKADSKQIHDRLFFT